MPTIDEWKNCICVIFGTTQRLALFVAFCAVSAALAFCVSYILNEHGGRK